MSQIRELIIIGAGPAGITASVYAVRKGLNILVVSEDIGGQTAWSGDIENYTGYQFISGPELASKFEQHLRQYDIQLKENEKVIELKKEGGLCLVKTNKDTYKSKTVIVVSGKRSRQLNVPGEEEFKNKGLTYCATCDGPLFRDKDVVVIGGGNSALDACLGLINIARKIYLVNNAAKLGGDEIMREKVTRSDKVTVFNNSFVTAVLGDKFVNTIKIKERTLSGTGTPPGTSSLVVQGVFVEIGLIPNSEFAHSLDKNELGEIKVNNANQTNVSAIFAAGDVTDVPEKQIIIAAGEGAKAALGVFSYLAKAK